MRVNPNTTYSDFCYSGRLYTEYIEEYLYLITVKYFN